MSETEKIINKIVADFEGAMGRLESKSIFSDIYGENRSTSQEIYARHKRQNDARIVRQNILKRILWLNLGTWEWLMDRKISQPSDFAIRGL